MSNIFVNSVSKVPSPQVRTEIDQQTIPKVFLIRPDVRVDLRTKVLGSPTAVLNKKDDNIVTFRVEERHTAKVKDLLRVS